VIKRLLFATYTQTVGELWVPVTGFVFWVTEPVTVLELETHDPKPVTHNSPTVWV